MDMPKFDVQKHIENAKKLNSMNENDFENTMINLTIKVKVLLMEEGMMMHIFPHFFMSMFQNSMDFLKENENNCNHENLN